MKNELKFWQVDSFTDVAFKGNPAGVVYLKDDISDVLKQKIANEMNLSETAFVVSKERRLQIRWFTPASEVDLCGHATLAAAHILWQEGLVKGDTIEFDSRSGVLGVSQSTGLYTLDFPKQAGTEKPEYAEQMSAIIKAPIKYIASNGADCLLVLESDQQIRNLNPDLNQVARLKERGLLVAAQDSSGKYDYVYRAYFPRLGIPEDPVTGSANTILCPYWAKTLGKTKLHAFQASERGGELWVEDQSDRVLISGKAVTVLTGVLTF